MLLKTITGGRRPNECGNVNEIGGGEQVRGRPLGKITINEFVAGPWYVWKGLLFVAEQTETSAGYARVNCAVYLSLPFSLIKEISIYLYFFS